MRHDDVDCAAGDLSPRAGGRTEQLFFVGVREKRIGRQPARPSNWEGHPMYAIDVCRFSTFTACTPDDTRVWSPLDGLYGGGRG